jgi:hypothetical protein
MAIDLKKPVVSILMPQKKVTQYESIVNMSCRVEGWKKRQCPNR